MKCNTQTPTLIHEMPASVSELLVISQILGGLCSSGRVLEKRHICPEIKDYLLMECHLEFDLASVLVLVRVAAFSSSVCSPAEASKSCLDPA